MGNETDRDEVKELGRAEIDALKGPVLLEFGASWCGHCKAAEPLVASVRAEYPGVRFIWVDDGKGKALGRSFDVKLWPTLIFLRDGQECERLVRPDEVDLLAQAMAKICHM
jgi:Thiol-disulfide isomerase and thioredoxins